MSSAPRRFRGILAAMNKPSDNFFAEMLTKGLGASFGGAGTTARGIRSSQVPGIAGDRRQELHPDRRLGTELRRLADAARYHHAAAGHGEAGRLAHLLGLAVGGRHRRHPVRPHARDGRPEEPPRQDRHAHSGQQPLGLRHERQRRVARLLDAHEPRELDRRGTRACAGRHRGPWPLAAGRHGRLDPRAEPGGPVVWRARPER